IGGDGDGGKAVDEVVERDRGDRPVHQVGIGVFVSYQPDVAERNGCGVWIQDLDELRCRAGLVDSVVADLGDEQVSARGRVERGEPADTPEWNGAEAQVGFEWRRGAGSAGRNSSRVDRDDERLTNSLGNATSVGGRPRRRPATR